MPKKEDVVIWFIWAVGLTCFTLAICMICFGSAGIDLCKAQPRLPISLIGECTKLLMPQKIPLMRLVFQWVELSY